MKNLVLLPAIAAALAAPSAVLAQATPATAPASPHTFTANVGLVSDYLFRGISQTRGKPALQGGADYSHSSGLYAGVWGSNIKWVSDAQNVSVPVEVDLYGGYKNAFAGGDWNYDVGYIAYTYGGSKDVPLSPSAKADTQEVYGALGWKWLTAKYSYSTSRNFIGWYGGPAGANSGTVANPTRTDTRGSGYLELNAAYDLGDGWGITGHIGTQKVANYQAVGQTDASYSDYKIGATKDLGFGVLGLAYSTTSVKGTCNASGGTSAYCWGVYNSGSNTTGGFRNMAQGQAVLSFSKTF